MAADQLKLKTLNDTPKLIFNMREFIFSKKDLSFFIKADLMMNRGYFHQSPKTIIRNILFRDHIMNYLVSMRYCEYFKNTEAKVKNPISCLFHKIRFRNLGIKLGFSIGLNSLGYGVVIPHYGTIVVGGSNRIGNYAVLHTSICISDNGKVIGDGFYCSSGVKITSKVVLGNNISVGANSLVNKDVERDNVMIAGAPAIIIKDSPAWYVRDGELYHQRVKYVEELKSATMKD